MSWRNLSNAWNAKPAGARGSLDRGRREFLQVLGAGVLGLTPASARTEAPERSGEKPLRGVFPIAQTPFTESDKLDLEALAEEVKFIDRGGVHGFVWPQLASEWSTLTEKERLEGTEAILAAGKKLRPAIVIGVQDPDPATAVRYARHAEKLGADAIISLPPAERNDPKTVLEYYQALGSASALPLFVQAVGDMSVEMLLEIHRAVPTALYVKDEAGQPLRRIGPLRERSSNRLHVFSGAHGRTLIEEMRRGFSGTMPAACFADLYARTWDFWQAGKRAQAMEMHARTLLAVTEMLIHGLEAMKYVLCLRGVFKTYRVRARRPDAFAGAAAIATGSAEAMGARLDEAARRSLREVVDFLGPYFTA